MGWSFSSRILPTQTRLTSRHSQAGRNENGSVRVSSIRSAGSRVMVSTAATTIARVLVKASGLNSRPSSASSASTGRNDTPITSSVKKLVPATWLIAFWTSGFGSPGRPAASHSSSFLWVCSTTTMAASPRAPMAMAMPPSDMMLAVRPMPSKGTKEISTASGMVTIGMIALGTCHRNSRITKHRVRMTSMIVRFRLSTERWMRSARS